MTQGTHHSTSTDRPDLRTLSGAVNATYDRLDPLADLALAHWHRLAPPPAGVPCPVTADGTVLPPYSPGADWIRRAALTAASGLTYSASGTASFDAAATAFLADLGRDLRKDGVTVEHHTAVAEALGRALCELYDQPYPGAELTYQAAEDAGLPQGLTELLQTVELGVRITALGAVEDEEAGIPAAADAEVVEVQHRTPRVTVVRLIASPARTGWPGQSLEVRSPGRQGWWSAASAVAPNDAGMLEFHLVHDGAGAAGDSGASAVPAVTVGEHWAVANPTGALELPADDPVLMIALGAGLAPLRALLLDASTRTSVPAVDLYWQVDHRADLHEYTGMLGLAGAFSWLAFAPVVTTDVTDSADGDDAWFAVDPARERFAAYAHPDAGKQAAGRPLRHGRVVDLALADGVHRGRRVLVAGGPGDAAAVREVVATLTAAGVDAADITAEPV